MKTINTIKSVHFAPQDSLEQVKIVRCDHSDEFTYASDLYVTDCEFQQSKRGLSRLASRAKAQCAQELLQGTFTKPSARARRQLVLFSRNYGEYRGIERWISKTHFEERSIHRKTAIQSVLTGQEMARTQGLKPDELNLQLRKVALFYSLDAKVFARRVGRADEAATKEQKLEGTKKKASKRRASKDLLPLNVHDRVDNIIPCKASAA